MNNGASHARQSVCRSILLVQRYIDEQHVWPENSGACRKVKPESSRATENRVKIISSQKTTSRCLAEHIDAPQRGREPWERVAISAEIDSCSPSGNLHVASKA